MQSARDGELQQHAEDLWSVRTPLELAIGDIGTRMTVMRLWDGSLVLHSPVKPSEALREQIDHVGQVRWIVAPSLVHHFFCGHWAEAYPDAFVCAPVDLGRKRKDLEIHRVLDAELAERWNAEIEIHPLRGAPRMNEVVFFHASSRTLVLTDLAFNVKSSVRNDARLFHFLVGAVDRFGPHRLVRSFFSDKAAVRSSVDEILAWDFDRIIVTHGEVMESGGHAAFAEAFAYLKR